MAVMIARIEGLLEHVGGGSVLIRPENGGLTYQVLVSSYTGARLGGSIGQRVSLFTLDYLESQNQGATFTPRLAGFLTEEDRRFFELFTTCKGIGNRKALRAMTLATGQLAAAIADRDVALLRSLPEIGPRTAETVVATLHGKVDAFLAAPATPEPGDTTAASPTRAIAREAMEVLLQLGETRAQVLAWIDQALRGGDKPQTAQDLIARVYQIKAGG